MIGIWAFLHMKEITQPNPTEEGLQNLENGLSLLFIVVCPAAIPNEKLEKNREEFTPI